MARSRRQPSTIDKLPEEVRALIGGLLTQGATLDQILAHLKAMAIPEAAAVSRSALGRHALKLDAIGERIRASRAVATALAERLGDQPDNKLARLNLELMHDLVMRTATATVEDENGETQPVLFSPEDVRFLSQSLSALASAQKTDADRYAKAKIELQREQAASVDKLQKRLGWSADTAAQVRAEILGVKPAAA